MSAFKSMNEPVKKIPSLERIPSLEKEAKCHVLYVGVGGIVCAWMCCMYVCVQVCVYVCVLRGFAGTMAYILGPKINRQFCMIQINQHMQLPSFIKSMAIKQKLGINTPY